VCAALGDWKRAALAWSEALKLEPTGKLHVDRGSAYMKIGAYDQAAADFRAAALLDPDDAVAHANLAWVLLYHLDTSREEALEHAQRAVELAPDTGRHDTLALAYHKTGQLQKALEQYGMAVQLNPLQVGSYKRRGDVYRELGDRAAALADYQQYLRLAPQAEDCAEVQALAQSMVGR
jgi:tetratricopeptide (TPR) repeat protein